MTVLFYFVLVGRDGACSSPGTFSPSRSFLFITAFHFFLLLNRVPKPKFLCLDKVCVWSCAHARTHTRSYAANPRVLVRTRACGTHSHATGMCTRVTHTHVPANTHARTNTHIQAQAHMHGAGEGRSLHDGSESSHARVGMEKSRSLDFPAILFFSPLPSDVSNSSLHS